MTSSEIVIRKFNGRFRATEDYTLRVDHGMSGRDVVLAIDGSWGLACSSRNSMCPLDFTDETYCSPSSMSKHCLDLAILFSPQSPSLVPVMLSLST